MTSLGIQRMVALGLVAKFIALMLALFLYWPGEGPVVRPAQAQEKKAAAQPQKENAPALEDKANVPVKNEAESKNGQAQTPPGAGPQGGMSPQVKALIEEKRVLLEEEEARIKLQRKELEKLRLEVNLRITELKKVQAALVALVKTEQVHRKKRIMQLVKVLSNMRPPSAAAVLAKLDDQMAVEIFSVMPSRQAGKVMAALDPAQAARISEHLTRKKKARKAARAIREQAERMAGKGPFGQEKSPPKR